MPASGRSQVRTRAGPAQALPEDPAIRLAFTDRTVGNVSLVVGGGDPSRARARALGMVGLPPHGAVFMEQVHGDRVLRVGPGERGRGAHSRGDAMPATDALVTTADDVALVVLVADCVPVLLAAPGRGIAAAHAGRRGIQAGLLRRTVETLCAATHTAPDELVALLGPAIGGCCYEVPGELAEQVAAVEPAARSTTTWGTPALDLPRAADAQLRRLGLGRIERVAACTRCEADTWYSHRATTGWGADAGRQAGLIARVPACSAGPSLH